jgi:hypothetical protein
MIEISEVFKFTILDRLIGAPNFLPFPGCIIVPTGENVSIWDEVSAAGFATFQMVGFLRNRLATYAKWKLKN